MFDDASTAFVRLEKAVKLVKNGGIYIGVQGTKGSDLVTIAMANEFGVPSRSGKKRWRIPPRSFLRATMDRRREEYARLLEEAVQRSIDGRPQREQLEKIGAIAVGDVQRFMTELRYPPNAPSTIRRKGSSNPLIDTGRLRRSITFKVELDTDTDDQEVP